MRHLDKDASAVAGVGLAAARAAVVKVHEDLESLLYDGMGLAALDIDDKADTAGVVFVGGVIKALWAWRQGPGSESGRR